MTIEFKPSDVFLNTVPPLTGTMGHAEAEHAAALLVRACQVRDDAWGPVGPRELGEVIKADLEAKREPLHSLNRNPFFRPDFHELVSKGLARWTNGSPENGSPIELTSKGIESLHRWVRKRTIGGR